MLVASDDGRALLTGNDHHLTGGHRAAVLVSSWWSTEAAVGGRRVPVDLLGDCGRPAQAGTDSA